jgi:hypothetical protein
LKNVLLSGAVAVALPLAIWAMTTHSLESLWPITEYFQRRPLNLMFGTYFFGVYGLALFSLLWNSFRPGDAEARRKTRVILGGTTLAILPWFMLQLIATTFRLETYSLPFWIWGPVVILIFFMPLSFAYAVLPKSGVKFAVFMRICPKIGICARNLCSTRSNLVWVTQSPSGFNLCTRRKIFSPSRARKGELNSRSVGRFCGRVSSPGSQKSLCRSLLSVKVCHS